MSEERFRVILEEVLEEKLETKLEEKLDAKLEEKLEAKLEEKLDAKLEEKLEAKLEEKLDAKLEEKLDAKLDIKLERTNTRLDSLEGRMDHAESEMHRISLILENDVVRPIRLLCENLYPTSKGWIENEHRLSTLEEDVAVIKTVVKQHSDSIHMLRQA